MKNYTIEEIERLEEIGDFYCSDGEMIPADFFIQEPRGRLSYINDDDDIDIFDLESCMDETCKKEI